jgi:hypothetical protein
MAISPSGDGIGYPVLGGGHLYFRNDRWIFIPDATTIGTDVEKDDPVKVGDNERSGGLYILGQPRTGKSNLLVSLALSELASAEVVEFVGERRAEATVGESGAGAPLG